MDSMMYASPTYTFYVTHRNSTQLTNTFVRDFLRAGGFPAKNKECEKSFSAPQKIHI